MLRERLAVVAEIAAAAADAAAVGMWVAVALVEVGVSTVGVARGLRPDSAARPTLIGDGLMVPLATVGMWGEVWWVGVPVLPGAVVGLVVGAATAHAVEVPAVS